MNKPVIDQLVDRFLACPLPESVKVDPCAMPEVIPYCYERTGTNLLNAAEAKQILEHVLAGDIFDYQGKVETILGLQSALKEVYALAGEDPQLAKIINRALEAYPFP